jgi:probable H4MPT-linked C1 transfer pathway protein
MTEAGVLGLDIGGANIKAAHTSGKARTQAFELWKNPAGLAAALAEFLSGWPEFRTLGVTMTGELCDCYSSRRAGVHTILDAVESLQLTVPVQIWCNDGRLRSLAEARKDPIVVASANWLALATFAGRLAPHGPALLIDVGSTTTDIVPLMDGKPVPRGRTDAERLRHCEMVYLGARRTPLNVLLGTAGAAEFFATMQDVLLVCGLAEEDPSDSDTADGRAATTVAAHARLVRMICSDIEDCLVEDRTKLAGELLDRWIERVTTSINQVANGLPGQPHNVVLAGSGEFLARKALEKWIAVPHVISMTERLGNTISTAACAYALAMLAIEQKE